MAAIGPSRGFLSSGVLLCSPKMAPKTPKKMVNGARRAPLRVFDIFLKKRRENVGAKDFAIFCKNEVPWLKRLKSEVFSK